VPEGGQIMFTGSALLFIVKLSEEIEPETVITVNIMAAIILRAVFFMVFIVKC
jgi:hypothetical protein